MSQEIFKQPVSTFLRLPLAVRERIYLYSGLVRSCAITIDEECARWNRSRHANLNQEDYSPLAEPNEEKRKLAQWLMDSYSGMCAKQTRIQGHRFIDSSTTCVHPPLPVQLFRVSKQIYLEVFHVLYSRNTIILDPSLPRLPSLAWKSLRSLEIQLTRCSCVLDHTCKESSYFANFSYCELCHWGCKRGNGDAMSLDRFQSISKSWYALCEDIKQNCSDGLQLTIICDCKDLTTATKVVAPLQGLPIMEHAAIRLGQSSNEELTSLAVQTVQSLNRTGRKTAFPFQRLPTELQEMILYHTDLIAHERSPKNGWQHYIPQNDLVSAGSLSWNQPFNTTTSWNTQADLSPGFRLLRDMRARCCLKCTRSGDVCCCPGRHAAYSSRGCGCWYFPKSLFLVNKSIRQLAVKIFCSQNRFVLWETSNWLERKTGAYYKYLSNPLKFLRGMPEHWSMNIRWLTFRFHFYTGTDGQRGSPGHAMWGQLTEAIKRWPWLPQLTIELDFAHDSYRGKEISLGQGPWREISLQSFHDIVVLFALPPVQRYKAFFVRLTWRVETEEEDWTRWRLEQQLERHIMGPDYDAASRGKYYNPSWDDESSGPKARSPKKKTLISRRYQSSHRF